MYFGWNLNLHTLNTQKLVRLQQVLQTLSSLTTFKVAPQLLLPEPVLHSLHLPPGQPLHHPNGVHCVQDQGLQLQDQHMRAWVPGTTVRLQRKGGIALYHYTGWTDWVIVFRTSMVVCPSVRRLVSQSVSICLSVCLSACLSV